VKENKSPWAKPVVVAPTKNMSGAWNDLSDTFKYHGMNTKTVREKYPTFTAEDIHAKMDGATIFS
jgi:hypothetical protein